MIAAAAEVVPDLWENTGEEGIRWIDHRGQLSEASANVYASWHREYDLQMPHAHLALLSGPFNFGIAFPPDQARALATQLVRAAELAEATQAALDAERAQE